MSLIVSDIYDSIYGENILQDTRFLDFRVYGGGDETDDILKLLYGVLHRAMRKLSSVFVALI